MIIIALLLGLVDGLRGSRHRETSSETMMTNGEFIGRNSIRFSNLTALLTPRFERYELLVRSLSNTILKPNFRYRDGQEASRTHLHSTKVSTYFVLVHLNRSNIEDFSRGAVLKTSVNLQKDQKPVLIASSDGRSLTDARSAFVQSRDSLLPRDTSRSRGNQSRGKRLVKRDMTDNMSDDWTSSQNHPCSLQTLYFNHRKDNLHPMELDIGQCVGSCASAVTLKRGQVPNHTKFQFKMKMLDSRSTHFPCCVPTEYTSVTYFDYHTGTTTVFEDAKVTKCGCR